jgi:hypothetical protein
MTWLVPPSRSTAPRHPVVHTLGTWLAVLALLIQTALPLADAAVHATFNVAGDGETDGVTAATAAGGAIERLSKQAPAHATDACPICQFISAVGSFSPPSPARPPEPAPANLFAVWPTAPPAARSAHATPGQPRAPPAAI